MAAVPRRKVWEFPNWISEHAFDKLRLIDCTFAEFDLALDQQKSLKSPRLIRTC